MGRRGPLLRHRAALRSRARRAAPRTGARDAARATTTSSRPRSGGCSCRRPSARGELDDDGFVVPAASRREWDFSRDGILRSVDASLERLGLDDVDILYLHDPDDHWDEASTTGIDDADRTPRAGRDPRDRRGHEPVGDAGRVRAALRRRRRDAGGPLHAAGSVRRSTTCCPLALERGVGVVAAGVYNSGLLAQAEVPDDAHFEYRAAPPELVARAREIAEICIRHGVTLPDVALQFPLRHPAVISAVVGARDARESLAALERHTAPVPDDLWRELETAGYLRSIEQLALNRVTTLSDLMVAQGRPTEADIDWLHLLVADGQLIADLAFADIVLWVPTTEGSFIAVAHSRPSSAATLFYRDFVGQEIKPEWRAAGHRGVRDRADRRHRRARLVRGDADPRARRAGAAAPERERLGGHEHPDRRAHPAQQPERGAHAQPPGAHLQPVRQRPVRHDRVRRLPRPGRAIRTPPRGPARIRRPRPPRHRRHRDLRQPERPLGVQPHGVRRRARGRVARRGHDRAAEGQAGRRRVAAAWW